MKLCMQNEHLTIKIKWKISSDLCRPPNSEEIMKPFCTRSGFVVHCDAVQEVFLAGGTISDTDCWMPMCSCTNQIGDGELVAAIKMWICYPMQYILNTFGHNLEQKICLKLSIIILVPLRPPYNAKNTQ